MGPQLFLMLLCIQINSLAIMQHAVPHFPVYLDHNMTLNSFPLPPSQTTLQKHKWFAYVIELKEKPQVLATSPPSYALLSSTHWHILEDAAQLAFLFLKSQTMVTLLMPPCALPWWLHSPQKYISLDIFLEVLTSRARNWILLCRTEKPCAKTPFAAVSINTHSSHCLFQRSL